MYELYFYIFASLKFELKIPKTIPKSTMAKDFPTRQENYAQWYNDLVIKADLAES